MKFVCHLETGEKLGLDKLFLILVQNSHEGGGYDGSPEDLPSFYLATGLSV